MKTKLIVMISGLCLSISSVTWSYDTEMAESYAKFFSEASGADVAEIFQFIDAKTFTNNIKEGKDYLAIDIRTPAETSVVSLSLTNSIRIPMDQLFEPMNLKKIPMDKPVVIICKSGGRATAAGISLRHIGFNNVQILSGGIQGLSSYYGTKQAYEKSGSNKN
jgi:rhodanese-related sulfurtransferase